MPDKGLIRQHALEMGDEPSAVQSARRRTLAGGGPEAFFRQARVGNGVVFPLDIGDLSRGYLDAWTGMSEADRKRYENQLRSAGPLIRALQQQIGF